jgi:RNA polymerase sigma-70 factor (ECF subfamily)
MPKFDYELDGKFRGWLWKVFASALSDYFKDLSRAGLVAGDGSPIADLLNNQEARLDLQQRLNAEFDLELLEEAEFRARNQVADVAWQVYVLQAKQGLPYATIGEKLGQSEVSVRMACSRVKARLKIELQKLDGDDLSG